MKMIFRLFSAVIILIALSGAAVAESNTENSNRHHDLMDIHRFIRTYDPSFQIPLDVVKTMESSWQSHTAEYESINVSFDEVLFDGYWIYTSASITAKENNVLLMPGNAYPTDVYTNSGNTYLEASKSSGKKLLAVYVYPAVFDELGSYFLDSINSSCNEIICISGANWIIDDLFVDILWNIEVYSIDALTLEYSLLEKHTEHTFFSNISKKEVYFYSCDLNDISIKGAKLIKTCLTTYIEFYSESGAVDLYNIILKDENGTTYKKGAPPAINTFYFDKIPKTIILETQSHIVPSKNYIILKLSSDMIS